MIFYHWQIHSSTPLCVVVLTVKTNGNSSTILQPVVASPLMALLSLNSGSFYIHVYSLSVIPSVVKKHIIKMAVSIALKYGKKEAACISFTRR